MVIKAYREHVNQELHLIYKEFKYSRKMLSERQKSTSYRNIRVSSFLAWTQRREKNFHT